MTSALFILFAFLVGVLVSPVLDRLAANFREPEHHKADNAPDLDRLPARDSVSSPFHEKGDSR